MSVIKINCYTKWLLSERSADQSSVRIKDVSSVRWYKSIVKCLVMPMVLSLFFTSFLPLKERKGRKKIEMHATRYTGHSVVLNQCSKQWPPQQKPAYKSLRSAFGGAWEPLGPLCFARMCRGLNDHSGCFWPFSRHAHYCTSLQVGLLPSSATFRKTALFIIRCYNKSYLYTPWQSNPAS